MPNFAVATCRTAFAWTLNAEGDAPEWIELIPRGPIITGRDGRAWRLDDPQRLVAEFNRRRQPVPLDFEHGSEAPANGQPVPMAGWIEELAVRDGIVVGRIQWTPRGINAVKGGEYRFVSPAFTFETESLRIAALLSAGLVHKPNLPLAALNEAEIPAASAQKAQNMIINRNNLRDLNVGFKAIFNMSFGAASPIYPTVAMTVPSSTMEETYAWLGSMPTLREWVGSRVVNNVSQHGFSIKNRLWESTIEVPRVAMEDDQEGVYTPMFQELGRSAKLHPDELVFALLRNGFAAPCYDGQNFFDADHAAFDETGKEVSVSNMQDGAGAPWFLLDCSRSLKPMIFQERLKPELVAKDDPEDANVFSNDMYLYGARARYNVGFGMWQMAYASKAALTQANFRAARTAMMSLKKENGQPLGIRPTHVVVGAANWDAARDLFLKDKLAGGETNTDINLVKIIECPWLA